MRIYLMYKAEENSRQVKVVPKLLFRVDLFGLGTTHSNQIFFAWFFSDIYSMGHTDYCLHCPTYTMHKHKCSKTTGMKRYFLDQLCMSK